MTFAASAAVAAFALLLVPGQQAHETIDVPEVWWEARHVQALERMRMDGHKVVCLSAKRHRRTRPPYMLKENWYVTSLVETLKDPITACAFPSEYGVVLFYDRAEIDDDPSAFMALADSILYARADIAFVEGVWGIGPKMGKDGSLQIVPHGYTRFKLSAWGACQFSAPEQRRASLDCGGEPAGADSAPAK